jgi:hypothetical protein
LKNAEVAPEATEAPTETEKIVEVATEAPEGPEVGGVQAHGRECQLSLRVALRRDARSVSKAGVRTRVSVRGKGACVVVAVNSSSTVVAMPSTTESEKALTKPTVLVAEKSSVRERSVEEKDRDLAASRVSFQDQHVEEPTDPESDDEEEDDYDAADATSADYGEMSKILASCVEDGQTQYLIKWKDDHLESWELADNIARDLVFGYENPWWQAAKKADDHKLKETKEWLASATGEVTEHVEEELSSPVEKTTSVLEADPVVEVRELPSPSEEGALSVDEKLLPASVEGEAPVEADATPTVAEKELAGPAEGEDFKESAQDTTENAKTKVEDVSSSAQSKGEEVADKTKEVGQDVRDKAEDVGSTVEAKARKRMAPYESLKLHSGFTGD